MTRCNEHSLDELSGFNVTGLLEPLQLLTFTGVRPHLRMRFNVFRCTPILAVHARQEKQGSPPSIQPLRMDYSSCILASFEASKLDV